MVIEPVTSDAYKYETGVLLQEQYLGSVFLVTASCLYLLFWGLFCMKKNPFLNQNLLVMAIAGSLTTPALAGKTFKIDDDHSVTVGVSLRTSVAFVDDGAPSGDDMGTDFTLENARFSIGGNVTENFKLYFGTEKMWGEYGVLDAIIQYEPNDYFNVWMGRMLTPADRIEMNGPFYALTWSQYTVPLYPSDNDGSNGANGVAGTFGRDEGITVWGTANKFQYAVGLFDGVSSAANQSDAPLLAARFAYNFLEMEANPCLLHQ